MNNKMLVLIVTVALFSCMIKMNKFVFTVAQY